MAPRAPGSPAVKKLMATVRRGLAERPPQAPTKALATTRAPRRTPSKLPLQISS
jgi:hypothetical protein